MIRILIALLFPLCLTGQVQMFFTAAPGSDITSPLDVDSLFYWFAADVAVFDSIGNVATDWQGVGEWQDLSGNGHHVTQTTNGLRPTYRATGGPNGKPTLVFDGTNDLLASAAHFWESDDITIFIVMKYATTNRNATEVFISKRSSTVAQFNLYGASNTVQQRELFQAFKDGGLANFRQYQTNTSNYKHTDFRVKTRTSNAVPDGTFFSNGTSEAITSSSAGTGDGTIHNATLALVIGALYATSAILPFQGSISEVIIYSRVVTTAEREAIERYLNHKYNIY